MKSCGTITTCHLTNMPCPRSGTVAAQRAISQITRGDAVANAQRTGRAQPCPQRAQGLVPSQQLRRRRCPRLHPRRSTITTARIVSGPVGANLATLSTSRRAEALPEVFGKKPSRVWPYILPLMLDVAIDVLAPPPPTQLRLFACKQRCDCQVRARRIATGEAPDQTGAAAPSG